MERFIKNKKNGQKNHFNFSYFISFSFSGMYRICRILIILFINYIIFYMKNRIFKVSIIPIFYIITGIIFFGNQDSMLIVFSSFIALAYHYLIDNNKSLKENLIETSGGIITLFIIGAFFKETDRMLVVKYISIVLVLFFTVFFLKKKYYTTNKGITP